MIRFPKESVKALALMDRHGSALLFLSLFAYYLFAPYQWFPRPGWVDPAIYAGHILRLKEVVMTYLLVHMSGRLAYNVLGAALRAFAGVEWGHYLGILTYLAIAIMSLSAIARLFFNPPAMRLTVALAGTSPLLLNSLAHTYPDGASVSVVLAAIAMLLKGAHSVGLVRIVWWFATGAAAGCIFFIHPMGAVSFACAVVAFLATYWPGSALRLASLASLAVFGCFGAALVFAVCALLGKDLYGVENLAVVSTTQFVNGNRTNIGKAYILPLAEWLPSATRLWWAALVLLLGLAAALRPLGLKLGANRTKPASDPGVRFLRFSVLYLSLVFGLFLLRDVFGSSTFLQHHHYSSHLLAPLFLVATALIGRSRYFSGTVGVAAGLTFLPFIALQWVTLSLSAAGYSSQLLVGTAVYALASLIWVRLGRKSPSAYGGTPGIQSTAHSPGVRSTIHLALLCTAVFQAANGDTRQALIGAGSPRYRDITLALEATAETLWTEGKGLPIYVWFDRNGVNRELSAAGGKACTFTLPYAGERIELNVLDSLAGYFLWDRGIWTADFPALGPDLWERPSARANRRAIIALLATHSDEDSQARRLLAEAAYQIADTRSLPPVNIPCLPAPLRISLFTLAAPADQASPALTSH